MARRQPINNKVRNGDFVDAPPFTAATTTNNRWIDGTAGGSTTNDIYRWGLFTQAGTVSTQFDDGALKLTTAAVSSYIEVGPYRIDNNASHKEKAIPVLPNTSYTGTFRMKTEYVSGDATNGATMNFIEQNGSGANVVSNASTPIKTTTDWTTYTVTFTTSANTRFVAPVMRIYGHQGTGTLQMSAWFDDITLDTTTPTTRTTATSRLNSRFMGGSTQFNGTTSTIPTTLTDNTAFTSGFVLHGWIMPRSAGFFSAGRLFDKSNGVDTQGEGGFMLITLSTGRLSFKLNTGGYVTSNNSAYKLNAWNHVIVNVSSNGTASIYVNGTLVNTPTISQAPTSISTTNALTIGNRSTATDRTFDGNLAELGIISLAGRGDLTADEITALYTQSAKPTGSAHFWKLDEVTGEFVDSIGGENGNSFTTTAIVDTFTRADNTTLGASWTDGLGGFSIASNSAVGESATWNISAWNTVPTANCEVFATIVNAVTDGKAGVYLRWDGANGYGATAHLLPGGHEINIYRTDSFVDTSLLVVDQQFSDGDSIGMSMVGSSLNVYYKTSTGNWTLVGSVTDATYSGVGNIELVSYGTVLKIDNFGGGSVVSTNTTFSSNTPTQARVATRDMGTALRFAGSGQYNVMVPSAPELELNLTWTLSCWVRTQAGVPSVLSELITSRSGENHFLLRKNAVGSYSLFDWTGYAGGSLTTRLVLDGKWHKLDAVRDGTFLGIYLDGQLEASVNTLSGSVAYTDSTIYFGANNTGASSTPLHDIDEPRIWNRALSAQEVADMYFYNIVPRDGLVDELLFDEASGSTAYDTSGNGNDGTITGATYTTDVPLTLRDSI